MPALIATYKKVRLGIHCDEKGKVALYGVETAKYRKFAQNKRLKTTRAMRSKRA